jgi:hypothetical protein
VAFQIVDQDRPCPAFQGVVAGKGLDDELTGKMFAAVVTPAGVPYYVRLAPEVAASLHEGDAVHVGFDVQAWLKPADKIIARFAQGNAGIYDPVRHQRALESLHQPEPGRVQPAPAERVAANVRRLERLARYRLATHLPDGRWQLPADLVAQLEARERTHPQRRLRVETVAARELADLGGAVAKQLGLSYVSNPATFRGHVVAVPRTPSGREYVGLVDHARRQLTLVPKSPELEHLVGRQVTVSRDHDGRLVLSRGLGISR